MSEFTDENTSAKIKEPTATPNLIVEHKVNEPQLEVSRNSKEV